MFTYKRFSLKSVARERGQSMTELALSASVLMLLMVGVLDLGRAYMTLVAIQNAAAEGALYGSIHPTWINDCTAGAYGCNDGSIDSVVGRVRNESPSVDGGLVNWDNATITVETPNGTAENNPLTVRIEYNYELFTPILSAWWPNLTLPGVATQSILGDDEN